MIQVTFRSGHTQQFSCHATTLLRDPTHKELLLAAWVYTKWRAFVGRRVRRYLSMWSPPYRHQAPPCRPSYLQPTAPQTLGHTPLLLVANASCADSFGSTATD